MTVRNFWIEAEIDGRKTKLEGGPASKDGGFRLKLFQRDNGEIFQPFEIEGTVTKEGWLEIRGGKPGEYGALMYSATRR